MNRTGPPPESRNTYRLSTERLTLELPGPADAAGLYDLMGGTDRREVCAGLLWDGPDNIARVAEWIERCRTGTFGDWGYHWVLRDRSGAISGSPGRPLGSIGTRPRPAAGRADVGYWLGRPYWGMGSIVQRLREGLFTVPTVVVVLCAVAARVTISIDRSAAVVDIPFLLSATVGGGRSIAAVVAGATITVTAIVFSITALISQIAASNYSPRAVAGFLEDRFQQFVIGLIAGTFAYSVLVLASLGEGSASDTTAVKSASITLTVVLGVGSVIAIVAYMDHSLERMRIDRVVPRIARDTVEAIHTQGRQQEPPLQDRAQPEGKPVRVSASRSGWVRAIDAARLARALPPESTVRVEVRVGEAVSRGDLLLTVWPEGQTEEWDPPPRLERMVHTAPDRSLSGDPAYGIRQPVDIGLRALSPGVNDPTTAVDVIHHLKLPVREILEIEPSGRVYAGPNRQRVFLTEAPSISDHVHAAFGELRLAGASQPTVVHALIEIMADLLDELNHADLESRGAALRDEAALVVEAAKAAGLPEPDLGRALRPARRLGLDEDGEHPGSKS